MSSSPTSSSDTHSSDSHRVPLFPFLSSSSSPSNHASPPLSSSSSPNPPPTTTSPTSQLASPPPPQPSPSTLPPPQDLTPTSADPLLTRYLPLAGLVAAPILALIPPRKLDLYTLSLGTVFGLSGEEYWRHNLRGGRRLTSGSGPGPTPGARSLGESTADRKTAGTSGSGGEDADDIRFASTVVSRPQSRRWQWRWSPAGQPGYFQAGMLDEIGGSVPVRGICGLGHDGQRAVLLLQQRYHHGTPGSSPQTFPTASPRLSDPTNSQTQTQPSTDDDDDEAARKGLSGALRHVWYGSQDQRTWAKERVEEEQDAFDRGEGLWDIIVQQIGEVWRTEETGKE